MATQNKGFYDTPPVRILLVENDQAVAQLISLNLQALNYEVFHATSQQQASQLLQNKSIDLLLIERLLPDGDGLVLCQQLRQAGIELPIIILTIKTSEADIILGLETGADDYICKPCSILELRARINARLRYQRHVPKPSLQFDGITINCNTREVIAEDTSLNLTAREFDLLTFMARHPQQVFSRMQLLEAVWGLNYEGYEHTVNTHINRLRNKLACGLNLAHTVKTVWGVGYKFTPPNMEEVQA